MLKPPLSLESVNSGVSRVLDSQAQHVGNLKYIGGQWKFKAVGYTEQGALVPGGGPLTARHNQVFARPDAHEVGAGLMGLPDAT
ncbi:MAG: hypothetical protein C0453_15105 [Comamonadaceae bacterium]|nr:hypothetical protein [Comamonadaceae bacterium]